MRPALSSRSSFPELALVGRRRLDIGTRRASIAAIRGMTLPGREQAVDQAFPPSESQRNLPERPQADPTSNRRLADIPQSGGKARNWVQRHTGQKRGCRKLFRNTGHGVHSQLEPGPGEGTC